MEMPIGPDKRTGAPRILRYGEHGYEVLVGDRVVMAKRLEAICYVLAPRERERIALLHGLQDAGEFRLARLVAWDAAKHHSST